VIAILGGLGAAICWSATTLCSARASRTTHPLVVLGGVMLVGLGIALPAAVTSGSPSHWDATTTVWFLAAGVCNVAGLFLEYIGFRNGKIGIVAATASAEGAVAAGIALLAGEPVAPLVGVALALVAIGVGLAALTPNVPGTFAPRPRLAASCAVGAAILFGITLFSLSQLTLDLPLAWTMLPARLFGVVGVTVPLTVTHRLRGRPSRWVVVAGASEVTGILLYSAGSTQDVAVAAVLASQFAAIVSVVGWMVLGERLSRVQAGGIVAVLSGVVMVAVLRV
jgi:drug/metabolite transporter (DMT)-like permease